MTTATATKERPILFSGPMVRAILDGKKTQTRRVVKPQPRTIKYRSRRACELAEALTGGLVDGASLYESMPDVPVPIHPDPNMNGAGIRCPYGQPGDRLWVRETWFVDDVDADDFPISAQEKLVRDGSPIYYLADGTCCQQIPECCCTETERPRWRPSIHMPRWASRITLEVTGVRVERLQEISEEETIAEGVDAISMDDVPRQATWSRRSDFVQLWDKLNAKRGFSWDSNPWVWVVEFTKAHEDSLS